MKKGKFAKHGHRGAANKTLALILSMVLIIGCVAGGTLAWLTDKTNEVTNTFTESNIDITLTETDEDKKFQMIPGWTIEKDPIVTVLKGSEDCWVFVEVNKSANLDDFIEYNVDPNNWTLVEGETNIYSIKATNITADRIIKVLENNQVTVKEDVTKQMMDAIKSGEATQPTLTFKAYAVQLYKDNNTEFTAKEAWDKVKPVTP